MLRIDVQEGLRGLRWSCLFLLAKPNVVGWLDSDKQLNTEVKDFLPLNWTKGHQIYLLFQNLCVAGTRCSGNQSAVVTFFKRHIYELTTPLDPAFTSNMIRVDRATHFGVCTPPLPLNNTMDSTAATATKDMEEPSTWAYTYGTGGVGIAPTHSQPIMQTF